MRYHCRWNTPTYSSPVDLYFPGAVVKSDRSLYLILLMLCMTVQHLVWGYELNLALLVVLQARSPVRRVYSPRAHSPTGRPPPVPKSAVRTKLQLRNRSGNVTQNSASSPSGLTDHSTRQLDGRQSKSWDNIGWLLVITISFLLAAYALQLDLNSTPRTTEDGEGPVLVVRQASESIQVWHAYMYLCM